MQINVLEEIIQNKGTFDNSLELQLQQANTINKITFIVSISSLYL